MDNPQADGEGNVNIINAAMEAGVKKFVLVTSLGTGDSKNAPSEEVYNVLEPVLLEKEKAEAALMVRSRGRHLASCNVQYSKRSRPRRDAPIMQIGTSACEASRERV